MAQSDAKLVGGTDLKHNVLPSAFVEADMEIGAMLAFNRPPDAVLT